jgi:hypothetical protein
MDVFPHSSTEEEGQMGVDKLIFEKITYIYI